MATPKEIKKRINAVKNTKKITKTMEMVATAKSKKCLTRVNNSLFYFDGILSLVQSLSTLNLDLVHPLLRTKKVAKKIAILVVSSNRGLCGGFNNNLLKNVEFERNLAQKEGYDIDFYVIGKKAISVFNFLKIAYVNSYTHIEDKPTFSEATEIANIFITQFRSGAIDSFKIISTRYLNAAEQKAQTNSLFPIDVKNVNYKKTSKLETKSHFVGTLDDTGNLLDILLPRFIRSSVYQFLLESVLSEQIYRRIAMKNATDNASDIIHDMTRMYNRVRQAKITQEIAEIVGGASAIES